MRFLNTRQAQSDARSTGGCHRFGTTGRAWRRYGPGPIATVLLIVLLVCSLPALSSTTFIRFAHLTIEDGLSQNTVGSLLQDSRGFVWMGTEAGLERYDGHQFRHFRHDPDDDASLADNFANALAEAPNGDIWIGTLSGGIHRLDPASGRIERIDIDNPEAEPHSRVWDLHVDGDGGVWAATSNGGLYKAPDASKFVVLETPDDDEDLAPVYAPFIAVAETADDTIVFGSPKGLVRVVDGELLAWVSLEDGTELSRDYFISTLFLDSRGTLWAGGGGYLFSISRDGKLKEFDQSHPLGAAADTAIWSIDEDNDGNLWIATYGQGLWQYSPRNESLRQFRADPALPNSLADDNLMTAMVDRSGLVWVGTESNGAQRVNPQALSFGRFGHHPTDPESLPHPVVWSIAGRGDFIWVGTQDGIARLEWPKGETVRDVVRLEADESGDPATPERHISSLHMTRGGELWIGALSGGLWKTDSEDAATYSHVDVAEKLGESSDGNVLPVRAVTGDQHGNLFLTYDDAVVIRFHDEESGLESDERWQRFLEADELRLGSLHGLWVNDDNGLWIAGNRGLSLYDLAAGRVTHRLSPQDEGGEGEWIPVRHGGVSGVRQTGPDTVWLGAQSGLFRVNLRTGESSRYDSSDGLPSDLVYSLVEGPSGEHIWASTPKGLARFTPDVEEVRVFDVHDGLQSSEFNSGAVAELEDGRVAFGGLKGINVFTPAALSLDSPPPPVAITGVTVGDREIDDLWFGRGDDRIVMYHDDNVVSFVFAALDFRNVDKNRFEYRLKNFDDTWRKAGGINRAVFTNLPAGEYRFQVRGQNSLGIWNRDGAGLTVQVESAPWFHPAAIFLYALAGLLLLVLAVRLNARRRHRERLIEREREGREFAENLHRLTSLLAGSLEPEVVIDRLFDNLGDLVSAQGMALFVDREMPLEELGRRGESALAKAAAQVPERLSDAVGRCRTSGQVEPIESGELIVLGYPNAADCHGALVPLRVSGAGFGLLVLVRRGPSFSARERDLLAAVATQAMMALENASLFEKVEELATTDGLTRLLNRRHFESVVLDELERASRYQHAAALLMLDIDHFKQFNDDHGHKVGDDCLQAFARLLAGELRRSDRVARYGGEEFIAYLPETDADLAAEVAERIRVAVQELALPPEVRAGEVNVSIGVAMVRKGAPDFEDLVKRADNALYRAKRNGRNRVAVDGEED